MVNEIIIKVSFQKHTLTKSGPGITEGDYNTTKLVFEFDEDVSDCRLLFKMNNPNGELAFLEELNDAREVMLVGKDENGNTCSLFSIYGLYPFELVRYHGESKLTSAPGWLNVSKRQVAVEDNTVSAYLPWLDRASNLHRGVFVKYSYYYDGRDMSTVYQSGMRYMGIATGNVEPADPTGYYWIQVSSTRPDIHGMWTFAKNLNYISLPFFEQMTGGFNEVSDTDMPFVFSRAQEYDSEDDPLSTLLGVEELKYLRGNGITAGYQNNYRDDGFIIEYRLEYDPLYYVSDTGYGGSKYGKWVTVYANGSWVDDRFRTITFPNYTSIDSEVFAFIEYAASKDRNLPTVDEAMSALEEAQNIAKGIKEDFDAYIDELILGGEW